MAESDADPTKPRPTTPADGADDESKAVAPAEAAQSKAAEPDEAAIEAGVEPPGETAVEAVALGEESSDAPSTPRAAPSSAPPAAPRPRKSGRLLATLALLLSFGALGAAGYMFYRDWAEDPNARIKADIRTYRTDHANLHRATSEEVAVLRGELSRASDEIAGLREALSEARTAMAEAVAANTANAAPAPAAWKLAEVEYLLTVANHRLLLQRDAAGALELLALSDQVLADLDDLRFHDVRALLADEQLALRSFEYPDTQGVFLRLEALKASVDDLPIRLPKYLAEDSEVPAEADQDTEDASMVDALLRRLDGVVRFRRHDGEAIRPLLAPAEAEYLEQHLRLALERAQLAVLRGDQRIFETSLRSAANWLRRFVDPSRSAVVRTLAELDDLQGIDLEAQPPDVSGSLARLRELRRSAP